MEDVKPSVRRCAVYTRKSSEEGLEQDFNSLHAQREACEAFIKSQAGEGCNGARRSDSRAKRKARSSSCGPAPWRARTTHRTPAGGIRNASTRARSPARPSPA